MIDGFLERDEDIPIRFLEHTKRCAECRFWLPYRLAIQKASNTVLRHYYDNECLAKLDFERLLRSAAACIEKHGPGQKNTRELEGLEAGDPQWLKETASHLKKCDLCMDYYRILHDAMVAEQRECQSALERGESVRPVWLDNARERAVRGPHFTNTYSEKPS